GERHVPGEVRLGDALAQLLRIVDAEAVHAADDETVQGRVPGACPCHRVRHQHLPLPFLDVADDADDRGVRGNAELLANPDAPTGDERAAIDAVVDGTEAAGQQPPSAIEFR